MKKLFVRILAVTLTATVAFAFSGCKESAETVKLDPKKPVTITVWHYYNGNVLSAFESIVAEFNNGIGKDKGIIVESVQMGNTGDIETALLASANKEISAEPLPEVFMAYSDLTLKIDELGLVADVSKYFTDSEKKSYVPSFLDEGHINGGSEIKILPVAKSTEVFMLDETDWDKFAAATGADVSSLSTMSGLAEVSKKYYEWTDRLTPDTANDGKAFFGRDSLANIFVVTSKAYGKPIFDTKNGSANVVADKEVMRKIWDYYYTPFISGYYAAVGKFRSDDMKVGAVISYIGSTSSASYFPTEITNEDGSTYPITSRVFPIPDWDGAKKVNVQQGAGLVVTKNSKELEYASVEFIKFFSNEQNNSKFSALSGYLPVKTSAISYDGIIGSIKDTGANLLPVTDETIKIVTNEWDKYELYTNKPFKGGVEARSYLASFEKKCSDDRETVLSLVNSGKTLDQAVAELSGDDKFNAWVNEFQAGLDAAING